METHAVLVTPAAGNNYGFSANAIGGNAVISFADGGFSQTSDFYFIIYSL